MPSAFTIIFAIILPLLFLHMFGRIERVINWENGHINTTSIGLTYITGLISLLIVPGEFDKLGIAYMVATAIALYLLSFWLGDKVAKWSGEQIIKYFIIVFPCTTFTCGICFHTLTYLGS